MADRSATKYFKQFGSVVQLVRMPPCHGGGRGFESRPVRSVYCQNSSKARKIVDFAGFLFLHFAKLFMNAQKISKSFSASGNLKR